MTISSPHSPPAGSSSTGASPRADQAGPKPPPAGNSGYRCRTVAGAFGLTAFGAVLPGSGFIVAGRRLLGLSVLFVALVGAGAVGWTVSTRERSLLATAVDADRLLSLAVGLVALLAAWSAVIVATYLMLRPLRAPNWQRQLAIIGVTLLCCLVALPLAVGARYAMVQRDVVTAVFRDDTVSATRPTPPAPVTEADPWGGIERVNVLLLGGDGGRKREGVRTDSMLVASMDVSTGDTVLFSLPRNLEEVPFPEDSPLHDLYPHGFTGPGSELEWMLNAVYGKVPDLHPKVLGETDNEGADALKHAVSGALGVEVGYYMLVNLAGFQEIVDAIGGVTVNINRPIPIGGIEDLGVEPRGYLQPGPDQHLNGFEALWFARGRYGLDDYDRMERQRCLVGAIVKAADDPLLLLRRYQHLAAVGKRIVRTDIPLELLPAFAELMLDVRDGELSSVVFQSTDRFSPGDPDYDYMHATVQRALDATSAADEAAADDQLARSADGTSGSGEPGGGGQRGGASDTVAARDADPCAYHPVG